VIRRAAIGLTAALALLACGPRGDKHASGGGGTAGADAGPGRAPVASRIPLPDDLEPAALDDRPDGGTVRTKLSAEARRQAHVFWGRKDLGVAPLEIVRPRGSAPLDLTIQAPGCLPLHTRVFTDRDDTLSLRLYTERDAIGLPGYSPPTPSAPSSSTNPAHRF